MNKKYNLIFISTADWDNPFWTNKQHMAKVFSEQGHKVLYFESLGLRSPMSSSKSDRKRILKRLVKFCKGPLRVNENLHIFSPLVVPKHTNSAVSWFNNWLMKVYMMVLGRIYLGRGPFIYWTYNPLSVDFLRKDPIIYHCVDDLSAAPGMPVEKIKVKEEELVRRAMLTFVTSVSLKDKLQKIEKAKVYYFPNVADVSHFSKALEELSKPDEFKDFKGPILGFVGAVSSYKVDFPLIRLLSSQFPDSHIVLIGLIGEGQPNTDIELFKNLPNVHLLGPRAYSELPRYLKYFDVALLPCTLNDYTKSMFPMKFFEYLSAEKKVVSTKLESLEEFSDCCYLANSHEDFIEGIKKALSSGLLDFCNLKRLRAVVLDNTWQKRSNKMLEILNEGFKGSTF